MPPAPVGSRGFARAQWEQGQRGCNRIREVGFNSKSSLLHVTMGKVMFGSISSSVTHDRMAPSQGYSGH